MGVLLKFFLVAGIISAVAITLLSQKSSPLPKIEDEWWGEGIRETRDESIRPFKIQVPDEVLADLKDRLNRSNRMVPALEEIGFQYGFHSEHIKVVRDFWLKSYNWREQEARINSFPHFKTNIAGLDIHFMHIKPEKSTKKVLPLLLLHGWPGSFVEFLKIIPVLIEKTAEDDFAFEMVIPSLPGYGFSDAARKPGLGSAEMGLIFDKLMTRLGFNRYYVQGGDWGSLIGSNMATLYPQRISGLHLNMVGFVSSAQANLGLLLSTFWPTWLMPADKTHLVYPLSSKYAHILQETGYLHIQATKPDTVGIALSDSPIGLAAYILEKFSTWTNRTLMVLPDGGLDTKFTLTELLDNVMVYWVTNSITSSMRLYSEVMNIRTFKMNLDGIVCTVPTGVAIFPEELFIQPEAMVRYKFSNLVSYEFMERGGHFGAFEEPHLLATDVVNFIRKVEKKP